MEIKHTICWPNYNWSVPKKDLTNDSTLWIDRETAIAGMGWKEEAAELQPPKEWPSAEQ